VQRSPDAIFTVSTCSMDRQAPSAGAIGMRR
jgi:hypothetical protein